MVKNKASDNIFNLVENLSFKSTDLVKKAALAINQTLVFSTPVDTGRARGNWVIGIDSPNSTINFKEVSKISKNSSSITKDTIENNKKKINSFSSSNKSIFISNNLPYIGRLNDGYSAQAPSGFVEKAVQSGINAIKNEELL